MRVLLVAPDAGDLAEYLRGRGHEVKEVYVNDLALRAAEAFAPDAVLYLEHPQSAAPHEDVLKDLVLAGLRVVLAARRESRLVPFAGALGVRDFVFLPAGPEEVLRRLENPAAPGEAAEAVRGLAARGAVLVVSGTAPTPAADAAAAPADGAEGRGVLAALARRLRRPRKPGGQDAPEFPEAPAGSAAEAPPDPYRDALTGCFVRRYLLERFSPDGPYAVVFLDLDSFKPVNDLLGHEAGDRVLAAFGKMLRDNLKGRDLAVRWGGDEFVLVLPGTSRRDAERVVGNLRAAWEECAPDTGNLRVGFSAGVALGRTAEDLARAVRAADREMYANKGAARAGAPGVPHTSGVPEAREAGREDFWETARQVAAGLFWALSLTVLVSAAVWSADFVASFFGVEYPALRAAARLVEEAWKTAWLAVARR